MQELTKLYTNSIFKVLEQMDVSIIIVNYNTEKLIYNCIQSIINNTTNDILYEIIVVDNASLIGSLSKIESKFSLVKIIYNKKNSGFGFANNIGASYATGKYIFLLNPDTIIKNNAVNLFFDFFENQKADNRIGALGCELTDENGNTIHSYGKFPSPKNTINQVLKSEYFHRIFKSKKKIEKANAYPLFVNYITGADLFIKKNIFDELGGFDTNFFMYYEETDLQVRMDKIGCSRVIIDTPQIAHLEGKSFNKDSQVWKRIITDKSLFIYLYKHFSPFKILGFKILYFILKLKVLFNRSFSFKENYLYLKNILKANIDE